MNRPILATASLLLICPTPWAAEPLLSLPGAAPVYETGLLEPEQAFIPSVTVVDSSTLKVIWTIADGTYLYRDRLSVDLVDADKVAVMALELPPGKLKEDEFFGLQQVYYRQATAVVRLWRRTADALDIQVKITYQGCAEIGVCYPPVETLVPMTLPVAHTAAAP